MKPQGRFLERREEEEDNKPGMLSWQPAEAHCPRCAAAAAAVPGEAVRRRGLSLDS